MRPERKRTGGWLAGGALFAAFMIVLGVGAPDPYAPEPPGEVEALPLHMSVKLIWTPSPSRDLLGYRLYYKIAEESWDAAVTIEDATSPHVVSLLLNGVSYDFMVVAVDVLGNESTGIALSATPRSEVTVEGVGDYRSVQAAIDAALPGEAVVVGPGTYRGRIILRPGVSLEGFSPLHTEFVGGEDGTVITVEGIRGTDPASRILKLSITGGDVGIDGGTAELEVRNVVIHGVSGDGLYVAEGGGLNAVNVTFAFNGASGALVEADPEFAVVRNAVAQGNGGIGIAALPGAKVTYSTSFGNTLGNYAEGVIGVGNMELPASFKGDFTELEGSPTIDAGDPGDPAGHEPSGDRINLGAFGNTPYAASAPEPVLPEGGEGGACGALGLEFLLALFALRALLARSRQAA